MDAEDELEEVEYQAGIAGAGYALEMARTAAALAGASAAEIEEAVARGAAAQPEPNR